MMDAAGISGIFSRGRQGEDAKNRRGVTKSLQKKGN